MSAQGEAEPGKGIIGRVYEEGRPVIYKFVNELPPAGVREDLPWLLVISWRYDGSANNGMPPEAENRRMNVLEDTVERDIAGDGVLRHAYSRTGNGLKELVYYIHGPEQFLEDFNRAVGGHPEYPIDIRFYEDRDWKDLASLLEDFSGAGRE
jgi:hypothetical protein